MYDAENVEFKFSRLRRHLNVLFCLLFSGRPKDSMREEGRQAAEAVFFFIFHYSLFREWEMTPALLSMELYMPFNIIACGILGCFNPL